MARPLRIEYPGAFYHIASRGNERRAIFRDVEDRKRLLSYFQSAFERYQAMISLFCLMNNHYHLLLETPSGNLSAILHHINAGYSGYFNRRHRRVGHLLQGRFKSILVEKNVYALELSRYIHLNPVRAAVVEVPEDYSWSSYRSYIGKEEEPPFLNTSAVLSYFGKNSKKARIRYRRFVEEGLRGKVGDSIEKVVASTILGSEEFVRWTKEKFISGKEEKRDLPALNSLIERPSAEEIRKEVETRVQDGKLARRLYLHFLHLYSGLRLKEIAQLSGDIGESGVSQNTRRLEEEMKSDKGLRFLVEEIRAEIM